MISVIPHTINKKKFTKTPPETTTSFFKSIATQVIMLYEVLYERMKCNQIFYTEFLMVLDMFMNEKPCIWTRVLYETVVFSSDT
jgi:hypothetical protein